MPAQPRHPLLLLSRALPQRWTVGETLPRLHRTSLDRLRQQDSDAASTAVLRFVASTRVVNGRIRGLVSCVPDVTRRSLAIRCNA